MKYDENIEAVNTVILDNRRITIRKVADDVGITFGSCQVIFTDVCGMKREATKNIPKLKKKLSMTFSDDLDLLKKIIICDE